MACRSLLQRIFPTQGLNPGLPHCRQIFFSSSETPGSPRILEWVTCLFSRDLSGPRIESSSPALQADSLPAEPPGNPVIINLPKSVACTAPRVRPNVNCRLWVIMTCQPRFMYCEKCIPQVGMLMVGGTWKISVHSPQFFREPKNSLLKPYEAKKM